MTPSEPSPQQVLPPVVLYRLMSGHWIAQRSEAEYQTLLATAGFRLTRIAPTRTPSSVIEAMPVA